MRLNKPLTKAITAFCAFSTGVAPVLAATPVYKVYIPGIKTTDAPAPRPTQAQLEFNYAIIEHKAYAGSTDVAIGRVVELSNLGASSAPVQLSTSSPRYKIASTTCGASLAAGAKCTVEVKFDAPNLSTVSQESVEHLFVNKGALYEDSVQLNAVTLNPLSLAAINPYDPIVDSAYPLYSFLENLTDKGLPIEDIWGAQWTVSGSIPPGMFFYEGLLAGTPTRTGTYNFVLQAAYNGNTTQQAYTLRVRSVGLNSDPSSVVLADTPLDTSRTQLVTISNTGSVSQLLGPVDRTNTLSTVFVSNDTCSGKVLPFNASCTVEINHHPIAPEPLNNTFLTWRATPHDRDAAASTLETTVSVQVQTSTTHPLQFQPNAQLPVGVEGTYYELDLNDLIAHASESSSSGTTLQATSTAPAAFKDLIDRSAIQWTAVQLPAGLQLHGNLLTGETGLAGDFAVKVRATYKGTIVEKTLPLAVRKASLSASLAQSSLATFARHGEKTTTLTVNNNGQLPVLFAKQWSASLPELTGLTLDWTQCSARTLQPAESCSVPVRYAPSRIESGDLEIKIPFHTLANKPQQNTRNALVRLPTSTVLEFPAKAVNLKLSSTAPIEFKNAQTELTVDVALPYAYNIKNDLLKLAPDLSDATITWSSQYQRLNGLTLDPNTMQLSGTAEGHHSPIDLTVTAATPSGFTATQAYQLKFIQRQLQVSAPLLDFGSTWLATSKKLSYIIYNTGNTAESVGQAFLVGNTQQGRATTDCPTSLAPGGSCTVQVEYVPTEEGVWDNTKVQFSSALVPVVQVQGVSASAITLSIPTQTITVGSPATIDLKTYFTSIVAGTTTWAVDSLPAGLALNPTTGLISGTPSSAPSSGESSHTVTVSYRTSPLLPLQRLTATLPFVINDYSWSLSKNQVNFDQALFEGQSNRGWLNHEQTETLTVINTGNKPLTLTTSLDATAKAIADTFSSTAVANNCAQSVQPGASCTLVLTYTPTTAHSDVALNMTVSSAYQSKQVQLNLTAVNPLALNLAEQSVYTGTQAHVDLNRLLTLGAKNLAPLTPAHITWTVTGELPATMTAQAHALTGAVTAAAGTATTATLTATYAKNTVTGSLPLNVKESLVRFDSVQPQQVWVGETKTIAVPLTLPAQNATDVQIAAPSILSATNAALQLTPSHNCGTQPPGSSCSLTLQVRTSALDSVGAQDVVVALPLSVGSTTQILPIVVPLLVVNPVALAQPQNLTFLTNHPSSGFKFTSLASYAANPAITGANFTWTLQGTLPSGLTFDPQTQVLSGTPTSPTTATVALHATYNGITATRTFDIKVIDPSLTVDAPSVSETVYHGNTLTRTVSMTLPDGGTLTKIPTLTIAADTGTLASTCTLGPKTAGYSCQITMVFSPSYATTTTAVNGSLSWAVPGATLDVPVSVSIENPLSLPDQETWTIVANAGAQVLENFSALLSDKRTANVATASWSVSSAQAATTISAAGVASASASTGTGTFTIIALKGGARIEKTYTYNAVPEPLLVSISGLTAFNGHTTDALKVAVKNTSGAPLRLVGTSVYDPNTVDQTTFATGTAPCTNASVAPSVSCEQLFKVVSKDTASSYSAGATVVYEWAPQPTTKPSKTIQISKQVVQANLALTNPLSLTAPADLVVVQGTPGSLDLASLLSNATGPATYSWALADTPTGMSLSSSGVISYGAATTVGTTNTTVSVSYTTPNGIILTAIKPLVIEVVRLGLSSAAVDFGSVYPNTGPLTQNVIVTNTSSVPISLGSPVFPSQPTGTVSATESCGTLAVGASCTLSVSLVPGVTGALAVIGQIPVVYKGATRAYSGLDVAALILNPLSLNTTAPSAYEKTPYNADLNSLLSHNTDAAPLMGAAWTTADLPSGWTLSAGGQLTGTPTNTTPVSFTATATYKGFTVSGLITVVPKPVSLTVSGDLSFGTVYTKASSISKSLSLTNTTDSVLTVSPGFSSAPEGATVSNQCATVAPGATCLITVAYAPSTVATVSRVMTLNYGVVPNTHQTDVLLTATVVNPLTLASTVNSPVVGLSFSQNFTSNLSSALESIDPAQVSWTVAAGSFPAGISFNTATGIATGVATKGESPSITLTASYKGNSVTRTYVQRTRVWSASADVAAIDFGNVYRNGATASKTVVLTNTSIYASTPTTPSTAAFYPLAGPVLSPSTSEVAISSNTCSGSLWAIAATCTFTVTYAPTSNAGLATNIVVKLGNNTGTAHTLTIPLTGTSSNPLSLDASELSSAATGAAYTTNLTSRLSNAAGSPAGATWTASGLPAGLSLSSSTGVISGTPSLPGIYAVNVTASLGGNSVTQPMTLRVVSLGLSASPQPLDFGSLYAVWNTATKTLTLTNPTTQSLTPSLAIPASLSSFLSQASTTCTAALAPSTSCVYALTYAPTALTQSLAGQTLPLAVSYTNPVTGQVLTGTQNITLAANLMELANPLTIAQPPAQTVVHTVPMTALDLSSYVSFVPDAALPKSALSWSLAGIPTSSGSTLTFDSNTRILSGTINGAGTLPLGTYPLTLTVSYKGQSVSSTFNLVVEAMQIEATPATLHFGAQALGSSATQSVTWVLPKGGEISAVGSTIPASMGSATSTCTPGLKTKGYSCTTSVTVLPTMATPPAMNVSLSAPALDATVPITVSVTNPLSLAAQETWTVLGSTTQVLENFSTLLTDSRTADTSPVSWAISSPSATAVSITPEGVASIQLSSSAAASGTFTVSATKNHATVSRTYAYSYRASYFTVNQALTAPYYGYTATNAYSITPSYALSMGTSSVVDSNVTDGISYSLGTNSCAGATLVASASCTVQVAVNSASTATAVSATISTQVRYAPQPVSKPGRLLSLSIDGNLAGTLTNPLSLTAVAARTIPLNQPHQTNLAPNLVNSAGAATTTWTATGLPTGLTINATTGLISGTPATLGSFTATVTASALTPNGVTLTASRAISFQVLDLKATASAIDFGTFYPGSAPVSRTMTLTNTGAYPLTLGTTTFDASTAVTLTKSSTTCGSTLAAGASCSQTYSIAAQSPAPVALISYTPMTYSGVTFNALGSVSGVVLNPLSLAPSLSGAYEKTPFTQDINGQLSHVFKGTASAGTTWSASALPAGWTLSSTGVLTGTPFSTAPHSFAVVATNGTDTVAGTLTLTPGSLSIAHDGPLSFGTVYTNSTAASKTLTVTNTSSTALIVGAATSAPTTSVASNSCTSGVASGASCTIVINYLPTTPAASYTETLTLSYGVFSPTHSATTTLSAVPTNPLALSAGGFFPTLNVPYTYSITGLLTSALETVNPSQVTWTYTGALPTGVSFNTSTGAFSGTPTVSQATAWTLTAAYKGNTISRTYSLNVRTLRGTVNPTSVNLGTVYANSAATSTKVIFTNTSTYSTGGATSAVIGAPALTVADSRVTIANNTCTNNLTLVYNATCTFDVVVTPTSSTTPVNTAVAIAIKYSGITGATVSAPITAAFNNPLSVSAADLPTAVKNRPYSANLTPLLTNANGPVAGASWTVANLPAGLSYNATTNTIEGTPTVEINSTPTLTAALNGNTAAATVALRVVDLTLAVTPTPVDFGTLYARWASSTKTVTLTNNTTRDLGVSAVLPATTYIVSAGSTCAATLAVGASCTLTYTYAPQTIADKATGQQLTLNTSVLDVTGSMTVPFADNVQTLANPLVMGTPSAQTLLQSHPMTAVSYASLLTMAAGTAVPNGQSVAWTATGLPAGLTFNSATQTLSGTPTTAGTYSATLTTTLLDQTRSVTLTIVVRPAVVSTSNVAFPAATYPLKASTATVSFTLPNGGNIQAAPSFGLSSFAGTNTTSTTCTTGMKAAGYVCTASVTTTSTLSVGATPSGTVALSILGATGSSTISATIANPLSLPTQESWTFIKGAVPHTIEDFSTLVSDARGDASAITWSISSASLSSAAISAAGVATGQVANTSPVTNGTFTVTASKGYGVTATRSYSFTAIDYPLASAQTNTTAHLGYNTAPAVTITYTNSGTSLPLSFSGLAVSDSNSTDTATFALTSNSCTGALSQAQSCSVALSAQSTTTAFGSVTLAGNILFPMQPSTKPTRLQAYPLSNSNLIDFSNPLKFATPGTINTYQTYSNSIDVNAYLTNARESGPAYTWAASNLPAGLVINTTTGVIAGTPTAAVGTYAVPVSVSYTTTPLGTTITASTTLNIVVNKLSASMTSMNFGSYYADSATPPTRTTTITNTGTVPISNFAGFALDSNSLATVSRTASSCNGSLAVGASCSMTFKLLPSTWGTLAVNLNQVIQHNGFSGTAFAPTSAVLMTTLTLTPALPAAYDKAPYSININDSASHYSAGSPLSNVTWAANGYPAGWTISSTGTLSGTPSSTGTINLPTSATYNGITGYATYPLTVNPVSIATSGNLAYGTVYTNGPAVSKTVQITNTTATTLATVIPSITTPTSTLTLANNTCTAALAPTASCSVDVVYLPTTPAASYTNSLTLSYGVASATHSTSVAISATPTNPLVITYGSPAPIIGLLYTLDFKSGITNALEPSWTAADRSAIVWTWTGGLPAGLTFNSTTGVFTGKATASESVAGTITATYKGNSVSKAYVVRTRTYSAIAAPSSIDYGTVYTQQGPITRHIVVTNKSHYDTTLTPTTLLIHAATPNPSLSSADSQFTLTNNTCTPGYTMPASSTCEFDITYTPTSATDISNTVTLRFGNSTGTPFTLTIPITSNTENPLALANTTLAIGFKSQPYASFDFTTLLSSANSSTTGATWSATGLPAGMTLDSATGVLSGVPTVESTSSITVTATLGSNSISKSYPLAVYSLDSTTTPTSIAFGSVATNWEFPTQVVTYSNASTRSQSLSLSIPSAISTYVTKDSSSTCAATLAAGASCTFVIKYAPTTTSHNISAQSLSLLTSSDNAAFSKTTLIPITGTAYNPLSLSSTISQPVFVGLPYSYNLQTNNLLPLAEDKTGTSWAGSSANISASGVITLAAPTSTTSITASARATLRGNVTTRTYTLTPINATFTLTASPTTSSLGNVPVGSSASQTITIKNTSAYPVDLTQTPTFSLDTAAQNFDITSNACTGSLAANASCAIVIRYAPTQVQASVSSALTIVAHKYGVQVASTSATLTANAVNPLALSANLELPILGIPFSYSLQNNLTSGAGTIDFAQVSWSTSGSLPAGLSFANGVLSGTASTYDPTSWTVTATYQGQSVSRTYTVEVRRLLTEMTPADSVSPYRWHNFGTRYKNTEPVSVTQTMRNISTHNTSMKIMGPLWTSATLSDYGLSITNSTCTTGRILAYNETCSYTMTFNPVVAGGSLNLNPNWDNIPYFEIWTGIPFGWDATTFTAHPVTYAGSAINPLSFNSVPNLELKVGFPVDIALRDYLLIANDPGAIVGGSGVPSWADGSWWYGGTLPAGLSLNTATGRITGTPTSVQNVDFQAALVFRNNAAASNVFRFNVVEPIAYSPPANTGYLYGSSFNPSTFGNVFVEQTVTIPVVWTFNSAVQILTSPYVISAHPGLYVSWTNCAGAGTNVGAGYSCQANLTLTGQPNAMGSFMSGVALGVGANGTLYRTNVVYAAGNVLNPLESYAQEDIWALAAGTWVMPYANGWVYTDRYPTATPVSVSIAPLAGYNPVYLNSGWLVRDGNGSANGTYPVRMTITKQTSPSITITRDFNVIARPNNYFSVAVAAHNGVWAGYPVNAAQYRLTNSYGTTIVPFEDNNNWKEIDFYPWDGVTSSRASTDCMRTLGPGATCDYVRYVNPGSEGPGKDAYFGVNRAFQYNPQPSTRAWHWASASLPVVGGATAGAPGAVPNHTVDGLFSVFVLGEPLETRYIQQYPVMWTSMESPIPRVVGFPLTICDAIPGTDFNRIGWPCGGFVNKWQSAYAMRPFDVVNKLTGQSLATSGTWSISATEYQGLYLDAQGILRGQWMYNMFGNLFKTPSNVPLGKFTTTLPSGRVYQAQGYIHPSGAADCLAGHPYYGVFPYCQGGEYTP